MREAELDLETSNSLLDGTIEHLPAIVCLKRAKDLRIVRVNRCAETVLGRPRSYLIGKRSDDLLPQEEAERLTRAEREMLASGEVGAPSESSIRTEDGRTRYFAISKSVLRNSDGAPTHVLAVAVDITERKQTEEHIKLLMRELNHRSKNMLAIVQALARHTAHEADPKEFSERFDMRLAGLAASHDLLVKSDWRGVDIADLVPSQLAFLGGFVGTRVSAEGPSLRLTPPAAQAIGMAVHELATNAIKYGALSNNHGKVRITWAKFAKGGVLYLRMTWSEHDGPPARQPERHGFGHTVMVGVIEHELSADVNLTYASAGVVWEMIAPVQSTIEEGQPQTRERGDPA